MKKITINYTILVLVLVMPSPAHAYLDPGTGSLMLQLLLGGVAGVLTILKLYWRQIKAFISRGSIAGSKAYTKPDDTTKEDDTT